MCGSSQNALNELREQERALKAQYQTLLKSSHAQADVQVVRGEVPHAAGASVLRDLYVRLTTIREELQKEHMALEKLARQHEKFQVRLAQVAEAERENERTQQQATPYVTITPMTEKSCYQVIRGAHASALSFMASKNTLTLGSEVFGWMHKYRYRDGGSLLQYSISKTFSSLSAYELSQRSWEIMTTQKTYQELHSTSMTSQIHLVQRVNRDNAVLYRILRRKSQKTLFKTLLLASQFQVEKGFMTIYRAIDRERIVQQNLADEQEGEEPHSVAWLDMFAWTYFEDLDDETGNVRFEFGGNMQHTSSENASFWMLEVLLMALRWESKAVGPLFTLTP